MDFWRLKYDLQYYFKQLPSHVETIHGWLWLQHWSIEKVRIESEERIIAFFRVGYTDYEQTKRTDHLLKIDLVHQIDCTPLLVKCLFC